MFIRSENEIVSLMPTSRWNRPEQLRGWLEEEERVALEPLLGTPLYLFLCEEYERLTGIYGDITSTTIKPTGRAKEDPGVPYADVTEHLDHVRAANGYPCDCAPIPDEYTDVDFRDMQTVHLLRICQQIEFYRMLSHKAGLLVVSFNEGGGANRVYTEGYDPADDKDVARMTKDAFMSAGRSVDSLLLFLEADAKGEHLFTDLWRSADAFYLNKDLLFQTARVLNQYLDINGERYAYVKLVRDIRFCQNTYLKPRIGGGLLKAVVAFLNDGIEEPAAVTDGNTSGAAAGEAPAGEPARPADAAAMEELASMLRTALAFYVESRRVDLQPSREKLARRDSMTDAQQAMAMACQWIEENLDALGDAAVGTPIYNAVRERERKADYDRQHAQQACERRRREACRQQQRKLFTAFPHTHRTPEHKV